MTVYSLYNMYVASQHRGEKLRRIQECNATAALYVDF